MYLYNIDTLSFALDYKDYNDYIAYYLDDLESCKDIAKINRSEFNNKKSLIEINGATFEVLSNGSNGYAYILHNSDYEIQFSAVRSSNENNYPVFVKIKQAPLWSLGVERAYKNVLQWLASMFAFPINGKINRADLCCHTDMINFSDYDIPCFKTRANKKNIRYNGTTINGFEFGVRNGLIYCRIYDKSLEVKEKITNSWFYDIWKNHGANINGVWNIEFELKREFFREYNIETVMDMLEQSNSIWQYLTAHWLSLTLKDCTRIENSTVMPEWSCISKSFLNFGNKSFVRKDKQIEADKAVIIPQLLGYLRSLAAIDNINDFEAALEIAGSELFIYMQESGKDFASLVEDKSKLYVRG